jgi:hypothetical protein
MSSSHIELIAIVLNTFLPPCLAHAFSMTAGGIFAPLRKPGIETFFATSDRVLSYAAAVALDGMRRVNSTALSGRRRRDDDFVSSAAVEDMRRGDDGCCFCCCCRRCFSLPRLLPLAIKELLARRMPRPRLDDDALAGCA